MVLQMVVAFIALLVFLFAYYVFKFYENVKKYPKGPWPLPLIGNYHQVSIDQLHIFFEECHKKYGDVFTVWTPRPMVVLMEYEHIKEALVTKGDLFLGRNCNYPEDVTMVIPNGGVTFAEGDSWRKQRRYSIAIMKQFGMGKNVMENQVRVATDDFISHLHSIRDKSKMDFRWPIQIFVANMINKLLFGYEYSYSSGDCKRLMTMADLFTELVEDCRQNPLVLLAMQFRFIGKLPWLGWRAEGKYRAISQKMHKHVGEDISDCLMTYNEDAEPDCFVHAYAKGMKNDPDLTMDQLMNVCVDFFLAGMETTSTTLRWAVLFLAKHQDVQDTARAEILSLTGRTRQATMADRLNLPYTMATIHEIQRVANIIPQNMAKRTLAEVDIGGVKIPANTLVQTQFYTVHTTEYEEPHLFKPERFLCDDRTTLRKDLLERLNPFGMGKRQCAGESLARMELFLAITSLLISFRIDVPLEGKLDLQPIPAVFLLPPPNLLQVFPLENSIGKH